MEVRFEFSEDVDNFDAADIQVTGGRVTAQPTKVANDNKIYTTTIRPGDASNGLVTIALKSANDIEDKFGNPLADTNSASWSSDTTPPTVAIERQGSGPLKAGDTATVTFTFSEAVQNFEASDIAVRGGSVATGPTVSNSDPNAFTATITPSNDGTVEVSLNADHGITDTAGNALADASSQSVSFTYDGTPPTAAIERQGSGPLKAGDTATVTFTFSEAVQNFEALGIAVRGGFVTTGPTVSSDDPNVYTATITPSTDGEVSVSLVDAHGITDMVGNGLANASSQSASFTYDGTAPTVTIARAGSGLVRAGASEEVTFTFSEAVQNFEASDIVVRGGSVTTGPTVSNSDPNAFTATITPSNDGTVEVSLKADHGITDTAGNPLADPNEETVSFDYDGTAPRVTEIVVPEEPLGSTDPFEITIRFSEPVKTSLFGAEDLTISGGTVDGVRGQNDALASSFRVLIQPNLNEAGGFASQELTIQVNASASEDAAGNPNLASDVARVALDSTPPTVGITGLPELVETLDPITVRFEFDEPVKDFEVGDVDVSGATKGTFTRVDADSYTLVITPNGEGETITVGIAADSLTDLAGNGIGEVTPASAAYDRTAPTVKISGMPDGFDALSPFTVTYTFSEDVTDFDETDAQAGLTNAVASNFAGSGSTYTAIITPTGKGDVSIGLKASAVRDRVGNGIAGVEPIVIKNRIVEKTQKLVGNFVRNRMRSIASVQPELTGFVDGSGFATGGGELGNLGLNADKNGYTVNFATSLGKLWDQMDRNDAASLGMRLGGEGDVPLDGNTAAKRRGYDAWMQLYGARTTSGSTKGRLWVGYAGVHKYLHDHLLVGLMGQFDQAENTDATAGSTVEGNGWMVGPYMAARLGQNRNLFFDGRAAWGKSGNTFRQDVSTGAFDTSRWLVSGKLSGRFEKNNVTIHPAISLNYMKEEQEAFTDSLGNRIGKQAFSLGEVKFGPDFTRRMEAENGDLLELKFGVDGVWNFDMKDEIAGTTRKAEGSNEVRARLEAGVTRRTPDGKSIHLEGFYDGIGATNYSSYGGKARLTVPLP